MELERKIRIAGLAVLAWEANRAVDSLGMLNQQTEPNKAKAQAAQYALAVAEANKLNWLLREAQQ